MILISDYTAHATPYQAIILRELITFPEFVSRDRLYWALWGDREDGGPEWANSELSTLVCTLRPKLRTGVEIITHIGMGYRLRISEAECLAA